MGVKKSTIYVILGALALSGIVGYLSWQAGLLAAAPRKAPAPTYEGVFDKIREPEEVSGSDLNITEFSINDSDKPVPDTNVNIPYFANDTSGTHLLGAGFEVDDGTMGGVDFEVSLEDAGANWSLSKAYLLKDESGNSMDADDAVKEFTVEDEDTVDGTVTSLESGDYIFVIEGKIIGNAPKSDDMIKVKLDPDDAGDEDLLEYYIDILN